MHAILIGCFACALGQVVQGIDEYPPIYPPTYTYNPPVYQIAPPPNLDQQEALQLLIRELQRRELRQFDVSPGRYR